MRLSMRLGGLALTALAVVGCEDKDKNAVALAPSASALAPSTPPPTSKTIKLVVDGKGTSSIDMPAPKEHIKATTDAASGTLDVDVTNLTSSRGEVKIDLATLTTKTFDDASQNAAQTRHARCWLEVTDCEEGKLTEDLKAKNRYAVYAIRSVEAASAADLSKVAPREEGGESVRTVTLTTKGELLVHGRKVDRDVEIEAGFRYAPGAPSEKPKSMTIKTKKPFRVILAEHDVKPRDRLGQLAKASFHLLGTKVADTAEISLDLRATPQP